jgi:hypothetical protein
MSSVSATRTSGRSVRHAAFGCEARVEDRQVYVVLDDATLGVGDVPRRQQPVVLQEAGGAVQEDLVA